MCAVQLPADREKVDPGETVDVGLECIEPLSIKPEKPGFLFKEGGRTVGEGMLRLPAP
jgi:translation elongation factor EF-Tu-like GTPase